MNRNLNSIILFLVLLAFSGLVFSQSSSLRQIEYSGTLTDPNGNFSEGLKSLRFRIYDSFTGGTQLWSETHNGVSLKSGSFRVVLGTTNPIPDTIPMNSYLQIEVKNGLDWEIIIPRVELSGSIYSINSGGSSGSGVCPSDMIWARNFCIDKDRSGSKTSLSDAIEKCSLRGKRLCQSDEMRSVYVIKNELAISNFYISPSFIDYEFAGNKSGGAHTIVPIIYVVNYYIRGYNPKYFQNARGGSDYVGLDYPNVCYPNAIDNPGDCYIFAYFRCCK